jgi:hypothetical protein
MEMKLTIEPEKAPQFDEVLAMCGGRHLQRPAVVGGGLRVHFHPGDYTKFEAAWQKRCMRVCVSERMRNQRWRVVLRRLKLGFIERQL